MTTPLSYTRAANLPMLLRERILILDGTVDTMIQCYKLSEAQYRGERFADHPIDVKGNNELLLLTHPGIIREIHERYLAAGTDPIETNTFSTTTIAQEDYKMAELAYETNVAAAHLACEACDRYGAPGRPRFVADAFGPAPKTASISPDVNDPGAHNASFDQLRDAYYEQDRALLEGGADVFLVETIFDTLGAKAALFTIDQLFEDADERVPVMVSDTVVDASGRILSGQTVEAFWNSLRCARLITFGLDCALGATLMRPYIAELTKICDTAVSCCPSAGLPSPMSETGFDETPEVTSSPVDEFVSTGPVNLVGDCCDTAPEHIKAIADRVANRKPRAWPGQYLETA